MPDRAKCQTLAEAFVMPFVQYNVDHAVFLLCEEIR